MKKIKQTIIQFDDNTYKGYNLNAFIATFKDRLKAHLKQV